MKYTPGSTLIFSSQPIKMSKIERLNARVEKLLSKALQEVLEVVKETVSEYQEKTTRTQRENQSLKRRVQELQLKLQLGNNSKSDLCPETLKPIDWKKKKKKKSISLFLGAVPSLCSCRSSCTNVPGILPAG